MKLWRVAGSEERRVGKEFELCVDLGGRRIIKKKKDQTDSATQEGDNRKQ